MKKINRMLGHWLCTLLLMPVMWSCTDNTAFHDLNDRITALEQKDLSELNENISVLQQLISVAEGLEYIVRMEQREDGSWVMYLKSQPTVPVVIGSGSIGQPGANGKGVSISVREVNGSWFWVFDGVLTNLRVNGVDGDDGERGADSNANPETVIIPKVKISDTGYWIYSIDNGQTWIPVTTPDGKPVAAVGKDGEADDIFKSITLSDDGKTATFVLQDNTVITASVHE